MTVRNFESLKALQENTDFGVRLKNRFRNIIKKVDATFSKQ
jgi:hypothetical protein